VQLDHQLSVGFWAVYILFLKIKIEKMRSPASHLINEFPWKFVWHMVNIINIVLVYSDKHHLLFAEMNLKFKSDCRHAHVVGDISQICFLTIVSFVRIMLCVP